MLTVIREAPCSLGREGPAKKLLARDWQPPEELLPRREPIVLKIACSFVKSEQSMLGLGSVRNVAGSSVSVATLHPQKEFGRSKFCLHLLRIVVSLGKKHFLARTSAEWPFIRWD